MANTRRAALIVDDRADQQQLMRVALRRLDLDLVTAEDVPGALAQIRERHFDCAVVDLALGDEFGFPVLAELARRSIPTVVVTGHVLGPVYSKVMDLRPVQVVTKPFHPDRLRFAVVAALEGLGASEPIGGERAIPPEAQGGHSGG